MEQKSNDRVRDETEDGPTWRPIGALAARLAARAVAQQFEGARADLARLTPARLTPVAWAAE